MIDLEHLRDANGLYPVDIARIIANANPGKRDVLLQVGTMVVPYTQYLDAKDWLDDVLQEAGTGLEGTAGLFYGISGVGKSTILREFVAEHGQPLQTAEGIKRAVIRVSTPANPNLVNVYKAMVRALGAAQSMSNDVDDLRSVILTQLTGQDVQMVIFDEFTHIVEDRSDRSALKVVRALKELLSEKLCQVVFAGTEALESLHWLYGQFERRSAGDFPLYPFDWETEEEEWIKVMGKIQAKLPLKCVSPLSSPEMAKKMHLATNGIMDYVMKLLFRATSFAFDDGVDRITDENMALAFERLRRGNRNKVNPFGTPKRRDRESTVKRPEETIETPAMNAGLTNLRASGKRPKPDFSK